MRAPLPLALAARSLASRRVPAALTAASVAVSVALLVAVGQVRAGMRESFAGTIRGTDLIVGARGGTVQLLLYTVFGLGTPTAGVSRAAYERWRHHPAVAWTIPYALGDSHRGFRVIGTTADFFARYRFRRDGRVTFAGGRAPATDAEAAVGADVARALGYAPGARLVVTHGMGGFDQHARHPFTVVGVIAPTATPIDRAVYVTLDGVRAMHATDPDAGPPRGSLGAPAFGAADAEGADAISAFFVGTRSRFDALRLQREIDADRAEPLTAALPGVALAELWQTVGVADGALRLVGGLVAVVSLLGLLLALYSALEGRRREMAVLRAVGARLALIVALLVLESGLLSAAGAALGVALAYAALAAARGAVEARFGLAVPLHPLGAAEWAYLAAAVGAGLLVGLAPAVVAYRTALADGLSVRV